jgi:hypothetical protein
VSAHIVTRHSVVISDCPEILLAVSCVHFSSTFQQELYFMQDFQSQPGQEQSSHSCCDPSLATVVAAVGVATLRANMRVHATKSTAAVTVEQAQH